MCAHSQHCESCPSPEEPWAVNVSHIDQKEQPRRKQHMIFPVLVIVFFFPSKRSNLASSEFPLNFCQFLLFVLK